MRCTISDKLMDVPSSQGAEGVHICIWKSNYRFNQRWKVYRAGEVFILKSFIIEGLYVFFVFIIKLL